MTEQDEGHEVEREEIVHNGDGLAGSRLFLGLMYGALALIPFLVAVISVLAIWGFQSRAHDREQLRTIQEQNRIIQEQRYDVLLSRCNDSRERHDATAKRVNDRFQEILKTASPSEMKQIRASRDFTLSLIDALAPALSPARCREQARQQTKQGFTVPAP